MRHLVEGKKLGRTKDQRTALYRNLMTALILHERIETTAAKANVIRPQVEHLITIAKKGGLTAKRLLMQQLFNDQIVVRKVMQVLAPKYADRTGGYVRITKKGYRAGDSAPVSVIEFV